MGELHVMRWNRYGHARLYVNLPDGQSVAWFDLRTDQLNILLDVDRDAVLAALAPYLGQRPEPSAHPPPSHVVPPPPAPVSTPAPLAGWTPEVPGRTGSQTVPLPAVGDRRVA